MRNLVWLLSLFASSAFAVSTCPVTSGPLTLNVTSPRTIGISPLAVFFNATATTDSALIGNTSVFQDVIFTWNFSDEGTSGKGTWQYPSKSVYSSKNLATGAVAAHLYLTSGADTAYAPTVTANDLMGNTATCKVAVTAYDPAGAHGFPGKSTTCVAASSKPVAGSGGCPKGAEVLSTPSVATAFARALESGKRVLFKCGDTFAAHQAFIGAVTNWTVGAYGGCEDTQSDRPIFSFSGTADGSGILLLGLNSIVPGDGRLMDFDCEGNHLASQVCTSAAGNNSVIPYQITQYNLLSNGSKSNYYWSHGAQMALIDSVATGMQGAIGTFINIDGNGLGTWRGRPVNNLDYQALIGNSLAGTGDTSGGGDEAVRIGACMYCVFENNIFKDGNSVGATFKLFESNNSGTGGSQINFAGIPVQYVEISDNLFTGKSGAQLAEVTPQATCFDERFFDVVIERNVFQELNDNLGSFLLLSGERETVRNNAFYVAPGFAHPSFFHMQIAGRAGTSGCKPNDLVAVQTTQRIEVYNNTGYALSFRFPQSLIAFSALGMNGNAGSNSRVQNNLYYSVGNGATVVTDAGIGNSIRNNSSNTGANPLILNPSGSYREPGDFKPTANFSGGVRVPVQSDALGVDWPETRDLGAVRH
jgi:hypothetical protein